MTSRGPLNYTTVIDPMKSVGECTALLVKHGASAIGTTWADGKATGLTFEIRTDRCAESREPHDCGMTIFKREPWEASAPAAS